MTGGNGSSDGGGNRTVFRPSPLGGARSVQPGPAPASPGFGAPPQPDPFAPQAAPGFAPPPFGASPVPGAAPAAPPPMGGPAVRAERLNDDDIPRASLPTDARSALVTEAGPVLALAASIRSGRARIAMPDFHREASEAIAAYDRAIASLYPEETRMRARYALCATVDDIAQNLPNIGQDGTEWARRSLVVTFFRENIGGDRFWQLVDDLLQRPGQNGELIELYHACLAAGFEGRFRVTPDGRARLQQIMASLYGALEHPRSLSASELSPQWKGANAPLARVSPWNKLALAGAGALAFLLVVYIALQLALKSAASPPDTALARMMPVGELRLSRVGAAPPPAMESAQLSALRKFLAPEIAQKLVVVEENAATVRVRTTVGQLFQSGSDALEPGRAALFERIGRAVEGEPGQVTVEGHADSDKVSSLAFPDNIALSRARAQKVADVLSGVLSNPGRIAVEGFGDTRPIASNDTPDGKTQNRRVEIVIPRRQ